MVKMLEIDNVVAITTSIPCLPMPCPYCGGAGYVMADVGQIYECNPCKTTGYIQIESEEKHYEPKR